MVTSGWDSFSDDVSLKIWRFPTGGGAPVQCGPEYTAAGLGPAYVAFSPNGQYLAVALRQSYVDVFSIPSSEPSSRSRARRARSTASASRPTARRCSRSTTTAINDGHVYADRLDGTPIASSVVGVDPDSLAVSPVANAGAVALAVGGYVGNLGVYSFNGSAFSTTSIMTTSSAAAGMGNRVLAGRPAAGGWHQRRQRALLGGAVHDERDERRRDHRSVRRVRADGIAFCARSARTGDRVPIARSTSGMRRRGRSCRGTTRRRSGPHRFALRHLGRVLGERGCVDHAARTRAARSPTAPTDGPS